MTLKEIWDRLEEIVAEKDQASFYPGPDRKSSFGIAMDQDFAGQAILVTSLSMRQRRLSSHGEISIPAFDDERLETLAEFVEDGGIGILLLIDAKEGFAIALPHLEDVWEQIEEEQIDVSQFIVMYPDLNESDQTFLDVCLSWFSEPQEKAEVIPFPKQQSFVGQPPPQQVYEPKKKMEFPKINSRHDQDGDFSGFTIGDRAAVEFKNGNVHIGTESRDKKVTAAVKLELPEGVKKLVGKIIGVA